MATLPPTAMRLLAGSDWDTTGTQVYEQVLLAINQVARLAMGAHICEDTLRCNELLHVKRIAVTTPTYSPR